MSAEVLTKEMVYDALVGLEEHYAEEEAEGGSPHGFRAIDVAYAIDIRGLGWKDVYPHLADLAAEGRLHSCVPGRTVPYYRTVGG